MERPAPLRCPQCGAPVQPAEDDPFLACSYCATRVFLDAAGAVRHFILDPVLDAPTAHSALSRWLRGREVTGAPLPMTAEIVFFPMWDLAGREGSVAVPGAGVIFEGLDRMAIPAGDLMVFAPDRVKGPRGEPARLIEASVPLEAARSRGAARLRGLGESRIAAGIPARLIHVPLHFLTYAMHGGVYSAAVDACSGEVHPITAPRSAESRIDLSFASILAAGLVLQVGALCLFTMAPIFSLALAGLISWGLYAAGMSLSRRLES